MKQLSSLKLAIAELATIAGLSAIGTIVKQNESVEFYVQNYPESDLLNFRLIWALQWDHIYTANYFLGLMALLAASLAACSTTRQWPMVKVARRWRMAATSQRVATSGSPENSVTLPDAQVGDLGLLLRQSGYNVFLQGGSMYAFKGLVGRLAPIGVHISMLLIMLGVAVGSLGGLTGTAMVPESGDFILGDALRARSFVASPSSALRHAQVHIDKFQIDYRSDGSVGQYKSDISLTDTASNDLVMQKQISVNNPLRYKGLTAYQTDWSIAAVTLRVRTQDAQTSEEPLRVNLPVASLEGQPGINGKLWATFLPAEAAPADGEKPRGVSLAMRDLQTCAIYDTQGQFVGIRRPGSGKPITVEGLELIIDDLVGSSGLELKVDPGIPYVYAGFGGLMVTTALSYLSHSQVWALQEGGLLHVSGKSNRAKVGFEQEIAKLVEKVPERQLQ